MLAIVAFFYRVAAKVMSIEKKFADPDVKAFCEYLVAQSLGAAGQSCRKREKDVACLWYTAPLILFSGYLVYIRMFIEREANL
ncbi:MAG: putative membrane protein [Pseudomonadales bacterium]|jgi:uncharacterized membrane protein|uniref:hypothetical protein n=1 Tax=Marinobacter maritimus TaxID=277961 RepID=UPI0011A06B75|nr:hypothetical protein [Marinobacter maritimus]|tara:strand:- start:397 stop:645 length:249 start_codon:yes stop_codon:yes gene_type:complete